MSSSKSKTSFLSGSLFFQTLRFLLAGLLAVTFVFLLIFLFLILMPTRPFSRLGQVDSTTSTTSLSKTRLSAFAWIDLLPDKKQREAWQSLELEGWLQIKTEGTFLQNHPLMKDERYQLMTALPSPNGKQVAVSVGRACEVGEACELETRVFLYDIARERWESLRLKFNDRPFGPVVPVRWTVNGTRLVLLDTGRNFQGESIPLFFTYRPVDAKTEELGWTEGVWFLPDGVHVFISDVGRGNLPPVASHTQPLGNRLRYKNLETGKTYLVAEEVEAYVVFDRLEEGKIARYRVTHYRLPEGCQDPSCGESAEESRRYQLPE